MPNAFENAGLFLVELAFNFVLFIILLRIILQLMRIDFYNPVSQWIVKATNPVLQPMRHVFHYVGRWDIAAIVLAIVIELIKLMLIAWLQAGTMPAIAGLFILTAAELMQQIINLFFFALLITVIASWVNPMTNNPGMIILFSITEPLLQPVRRMLPSLGGLDLSPIIVIAGLKLLEILLIHPLYSLGLTYL